MLRNASYEIGEWEAQIFWIHEGTDTSPQWRIHQRDATICLFLFKLNFNVHSDANFYGKCLKGLTEGVEKSIGRE